MRNPGLYYDVPIREYHADKTAIGNSGLKEVLDCPALYFGQNLDPERPPHEDKETAAQRFGNIAHCALFEFDQLDTRYRVGPDVNKNTKIWKEWVEALPEGCLPCTGEERMSALKIRTNALAIPELAEALLHPEGRGEVSAYWLDPQTGMRCKCRPDWTMPVGTSSAILWDCKTYATGDPDAFARQVVKMGYHLQAAWYSNGYTLASDRHALAFIFIVVGNQWPHPVNLVVLDEDGMRAGERLYRRALDTYAECVRTGIWPGYAPGIKTVTLPKWATEE